MAKDIKGKLKKQVEAMEVGMSKPRIFLSSKMLPAIKDWEIGEKYDIMISVKQESARLLGEGDGMEASFEVLSAKVEDED